MRGRSSVGERVGGTEISLSSGSLGSDPIFGFGRSVDRLTREVLVTPGRWQEFPANPNKLASLRLTACNDPAEHAGEAPLPLGNR